jgi:hypothetical protein
LKSSKFIFLSLIVGILAIATVSLEASAQQIVIPQWVKYNAGWWSQGNITDTEYVKGLQYLITQGIIQIPNQIPNPIPIKTVTATNSSLNPDTMAQSFVVQFTTGTNTITVNTFSKIGMFGVTDAGPTVPATDSGGPPQFYLESIPTKDKQSYYGLVNQYINIATTNSDYPLFDVTIGILAGDGSTIETVHYTQCKLQSYYPYVNDLKDTYRFSGQDTSEIRDVTTFSCAKIAITTS